MKEVLLDIYLGYVRITDLGIAKYYKNDNAHETSGTPGYMAPEVMCSQNHTIAVDYFALGVFGYEFITGKVNSKLIKRPYTGKSRKEIKENIMSKQIQLSLEELPKGISEDCVDFINKVIFLHFYSVAST